MTEPSPNEPLDLSGGFEIETPEQVSFRMERAGLGTRVVAALIDSAILMVLNLALVLAVLAAVGIAGGASPDAALLWVAILILFASFLFSGYYIGFETIWNGQTPGKRVVGIRVVGERGVPVTFGMVLIRNLVRLLDSQFGYAVGMISIFVTKDEKRLGDLAAGTVVVSERRTAPDPAACPGPESPSVDQELLELVLDYFARSEQLDEKTRRHLATELATRLAGELERPPVPVHRAEAELGKMARMVVGSRPSAGRG